MGFCQVFTQGFAKNLSSKQSKKLLDPAKHSATDALKTSSKRAIQKTAGATGDLIGHKVANGVGKSYDGKIAGVSEGPQ